MNKIFLKTFFGFVLIAMLIVTTWASSIESVFAGGAKVLAEPWGIATLFDTYFAFLTFYFWVHYKEVSWISRGAWFLGIMLLGNFAIAGYCLLQLFKMGTSNDFGLLLSGSHVAKRKSPIH